MSIDMEAANDMMAILDKAAVNTQVSAGLIVAMLEVTQADARREVALAILPQFEAMAKVYQQVVVYLRDAASLQ